MLNELSQTQRDKLHLFSPTVGAKILKTHNTELMYIDSRRMVTRSYEGLCGGEGKASVMVWLCDSTKSHQGLQSPPAKGATWWEVIASWGWFPLCCSCNSEWVLMGADAFKVWQFSCHYLCLLKSCKMHLASPSHSAMIVRFLKTLQPRRTVSQFNLFKLPSF